jgi:hypothetical protein
MAALPLRLGPGTRGRASLKDERPVGDQASNELLSPCKTQPTNPKRTP